MKTVAAILGLVALTQTATYLVTTRPSTAADIGPLIAAYDSVERMLPPDGVVGFIETSPDAAANTINYYVAQNALAPRVLSREAGAAAEFVVTTSGAREDVGGVPALDGFILVGTGASDVRVFRRRQP